MIFFSFKSHCVFVKAQDISVFYDYSGHVFSEEQFASLVEICAALGILLFLLAVM